MISLAKGFSLLHGPTIRRVDVDFKASIIQTSPVSPLYFKAMAHWLMTVWDHAIRGGELPDLSYGPAKPFVPETDQLGESARLFEAACGWVPESKFRLPNGERFRAFQFVIGPQRSEIRANLGIRGSLWIRTGPVADAPDKLTATLGFSLLDDEAADASHITVLGGEYWGRHSALVFADCIPSMIRKQGIANLARAVSHGVPPLARPRFKALLSDLRAGGVVEELRTELHLAHVEKRRVLGDQRGAMSRGLASKVLDGLERSVRAGLPSRRSALEIVPTADPGAFLDNRNQPEPAADVHSLTERLDPRSQRVLDMLFADGLTQAEVAERLGLTQARVSQIRSQALKSLRQELGGA